MARKGRELYYEDVDFDNGGGRHRRVDFYAVSGGRQYSDIDGCPGKREARARFRPSSTNCRGN